jgi:hypothetical protein
MGTRTKQIKNKITKIADYRKGRERVEERMYTPKQSLEVLRLLI